MSPDMDVKPAAHARRGPAYLRAILPAAHTLRIASAPGSLEHLPRSVWRELCTLFSWSNRLKPEEVP